MFRRFTAVFIAFGLLLCMVLVAGCGITEGTSAPETPDSAEAPSASEEPSPSEGASGEEEHSVTEGASDGEPSPAVPSEEGLSGDTGQDLSEEAFSSDPSLFPITVADSEQLQFVLERCSYDPLQGYAWTVSIENRSDTALLFALDKVSHDDVMCDPYWAETVAAGKKAVTSVSWLPYSLEEAGLTDITRTDCILTVYNDDDYSVPVVLREPFSVFPRGEEAEASQVRPPADTDLTLIDNESCRITMTGIDAEGDWGYTLKLYLENLSGSDLIFSAENVSVNGVMADPYWAASVAAGKRSASSIIWSKMAFEEKGIEEVEQIELPILVYSETNFGEIAAEETVTITPP